jgi:hypothetical protein
MASERFMSRATAASWPASGIWAAAQAQRATEIRTESTIGFMA